MWHLYIGFSTWLRFLMSESMLQACAPYNATHNQRYIDPFVEVWFSQGCRLPLFVLIWKGFHRVGLCGSTQANSRRSGGSVLLHIRPNVVSDSFHCDWMTAKFIPWHHCWDIRQHGRGNRKGTGMTSPRFLRVNTNAWNFTHHGIAIVDCDRLSSACVYVASHACILTCVFEAVTLNSA